MIRLTFFTGIMDYYVQVIASHSTFTKDLYLDHCHDASVNETITVNSHKWRHAMRPIMTAIMALATVQITAPPALAQTTCTATETMRGGANNYRPRAPLVENLGTGWKVSGVVRAAGSCAPIAGVRVQVWSATDRGGEREPSNHGSVLTNAEGRYTMEISEIRPQGGQLHIHVAYDDPGYEPLFLRPVLGRGDTEEMMVDFVLQPTSGGNARES